MPDRTIAISDIHNGNLACNQQAVLSFLNGYNRQSPLWSATRLIIAGDLQDSAGVSGWPIVERLAWWTARMTVVILPGNHDPDIEAWLNGLLHADTQWPGSMLRLGDTILTHGHQNPQTGEPWDRWLRCYASPTAFGNWCEDGLAMLPGGVGVARSLHRCRRWLCNVRRQVRESAIAFAREQGAAHIIAGHTHFAEQVPGYTNLGSWCQGDVGWYAMIEDGRVALH